MNKFNKKAVLSGIRCQLKRHPDCMDSHMVWDSYKDKPFGSGVVCGLGWRKAKETLGIKCKNNKYTKKEIIDGFMRQLKKHSDCMGSSTKWDFYNDKPFSYSSLVKHIGLRPAGVMSGNKYVKRNRTGKEVINGIKEQLKLHPNCMCSSVKWDSYKDKPFGSGVISRCISWGKAKEMFGVRYTLHNYTKSEIIGKIVAQFKKHNDCMFSLDKWRSYEDRPFSSDLIRTHIGWRKAKELVGLKSRNYKLTKNEVEKAIIVQFKRHPDCLSGLSKWDHYNDKPFCSGTICKICKNGWKWAKSIVGSEYKKTCYSGKEIEIGIEK